VFIFPEAFEIHLLGIIILVFNVSFKEHIRENKMNVLYFSSMPYILVTRILMQISELHSAF